MTLGFDDSSGIWPIFFATDEEDLVGYPLEINIGDLVMYRGCELPHWRPKYKGKWQVQVFFHYVDANGPYKDNVFDGRKQMGLKREEENMVNVPLITQIVGEEVGVIVPPEEQKPSDPIETYKLPQSTVIHDGVMIRTSDNEFPGMTSFHKNFKPELSFTPEECQRIVAMADNMYGTKSTVGSEKTRKYDTSIRAVDTYNLELNEKTKWIFDRIAAATATANAEYYRYNILGITHALQLLHYKGEEGGHYDWHIDAGPGASSTRKISVVVPLNQPTEFEGGVLEVNNNGVVYDAPQEPGSMILFPSFCLHRVNPVTKGNRWSLVSWVHGPDRFK
jgi:PKHD-type hydroxylase